MLGNVFFKQRMYESNGWVKKSQETLNRPDDECSIARAWYRMMNASSRQKLGEDGFDESEILGMMEDQEPQFDGEFLWLRTRNGRRLSFRMGPEFIILYEGMC